MKKIYTLSFAFISFIQVLFCASSFAQCADGNTPTPVVLDTTIYFETGVTSTQVKFPQFDPENGMLRCVKLTVTMTGVVDTVAMQNLSSNAQLAKFNYIRDDQMDGPGLTTPLSNSYSKTYGPYTVSRYDGNFTSGTDYAAIPRDTVLQKTVVRSLTDSTEISEFYGHDSVLYNYDINVNTLANMSGGSSMNMVLTSAFVRLKFEYCKCAKVTLPIGLKNFTVNKTSSGTATLRWEGENDEYAYNYDIEMSRDGKHFSKIATVDRKYTANPSFVFSYQMNGNNYGRYYFRVRQHWLNGYVRFTLVKTVEFNNAIFESTTLYPNPSTGAAGIKFVNAKGGKMLVQISNAHGQPVATKEINVAATDYQLLPTLPSGVYWVKITDVATKTFCVKQLLVQ